MSFEEGACFVIILRVLKLEKGQSNMMISFLREPNIVPYSDSFILLRKCQNMIYFDIYIYLLIVPL